MQIPLELKLPVKASFDDFVSNQKQQNSNVMSDFFLNAKIKTVNFFFTVSHFNAGISGYNYFTALHYPSPDRYFKLGLRWMFLN